jgi:hypothetical protein
MTDQEELRDDAPPKEEDETWHMGEQEKRSNGSSNEWDENEPSPHQGEEGQEESEA